MTEDIEKLKKEIENLEYKKKELENLMKEEKELEFKKKNFERFINRIDDAVIGKCHADIDLVYNENRHEWQEKEDTYYGIRFLNHAVHISGNCGQSYFPTARITESTHTYFHNVWTHEQEREFQQKLDALVNEEVSKIMNSLTFKLEMLGLQHNKYYEKQLFLESDIPKIEQSIWEETKKLLDVYSDEEFLKLIERVGNAYYGNGDKVPEYHTIRLESYLVSKYVCENRKHLIEQFRKADNFKEAW
jgi:hypothetical protein